ncbi:hypothetical protein Mapa_018832 [Marchantia paleacea]|nr:hypothetical protein Mapa_018832 [Marchantia paleacea]
MAIIKIEKISPLICELSKKFEKATKLILTALKINSRHINALTIFRLVINPKTPIQNKKALKVSICSSIKNFLKIFHFMKLFIKIVIKN